MKYGFYPNTTIVASTIGEDSGQGENQSLTQNDLVSKNASW